jgi:hypothetical protein
MTVVSDLVVHCAGSSQDIECFTDPRRGAGVYAQVVLRRDMEASVGGKSGSADFRPILPTIPEGC